MKLSGYMILSMADRAAVETSEGRTRLLLYFVHWRIPLVVLADPPEADGLLKRSA